MPKLSTDRLTKRTIDATKAPERGEVFVWDSGIRGFGLRVYASGRRLFVFQYTSPATGQTRRLVLGEYPAIEVEQARKLAQKAATSVSEGKDPKGDDADALQRRTLGEVFPEFLAEKRAKTAPRTAAEWERIWTTQIEPAFGSVRVSTLSRDAIARWHTARAAAPIAANRAVEVLRTFCNWAEARGYRAEGSNPCKRIDLFKEQRRSRNLTTEEYQRLGAALTLAVTDGLRPATKLRKVSDNDATKNRRPKNADAPRQQNPTIVAALRFLALSGWREQEALTLRWDALDLERGVATLTNTKTGRSERPLGDAALDVVRAQPRIAGNPYVFAGETSGSHIAEPKRVWQSVKEAAGLEASQPLRLHDLRHSFTTVARDDMGLGDHVIGRLVGHTQSGITSRYGTVRDHTVKNAANMIAATIAGYLNPAPSNVLAFPGTARLA